MSFIQIQDQFGYMMIISLARVQRVRIDIDDTGTSIITLDPLNKDDPPENIRSTTPPEDIWKQIKQRM